jgi:hypothetical protein
MARLATCTEAHRMSDRRTPEESSPSEVMAARRALIEALHRAALNRPSHDPELVDAIMTDDGNPTPGQ